MSGDNQGGAGGAADEAAEVSIGRLPHTGSLLFGRDRELAWLDQRWGGGAGVASIVAWGGVGKSALVNAWLRGMANDAWRGAKRVYGWSFYSQGTTDRMTSADEFVNAALRWFGDGDPTARSPWDKGERLAALVRKTRALLVLDGVESLQWGPGAEEGIIKDPALQSLVRALSVQNAGLCLITSRIRVTDADDYGERSPRLDLEHLSMEAGAELLRSRGATGTEEELREGAKAYGGHGLALTLLGSYLEEVYEGDIRRRSEIKSLERDERHGSHARQIMVAYKRWFHGGPEIAILNMLGLFNRPAHESEIVALRESPAIVGLTGALKGIDDLRWKKALAKLRRVGLLTARSPDGDPEIFDAHPLVREHFGEDLLRAYPKSWKLGHRRLYEHLKSTAKDMPETIEEMAPLYAAVSHGCLADMHLDVLNEVYGPRIRRGRDAFNVSNLAAYGAEMVMLSAFFESPWDRLAKGLSEVDRGYILHETGFALRALGRTREAAELMKMALPRLIAQEEWINASVVANNLSNLVALLGNLDESPGYARKGIELASRSDDAYSRMFSRCALARALHQRGQQTEAAAEFATAERILEECDTDRTRLYSTGGYDYCDLLLDQEKYGEVLTRAVKSLEVSTRNRWPLDIALDHLSLGRSCLLQLRCNARGDLAQCADHLEQAIEGLRRSGEQHYLPLGLLARADLHTFNDDRLRMRVDLAEALALAIRCGFRLHEADAYLGYARLHLTECALELALDCLTRARTLINATGYHRRDEELTRLEAMIRNQLLDALCSLNPPQLDILVAKLSVPLAYLPSTMTAPGTRIPEILRWAEQQGRRADVARLVGELMAPATPPKPPPSPPLAAPVAAPLHVSATTDTKPHVDFLIITALEEERAALLAKLPGFRKLDRDGAGTHTYYEAHVTTRRQDKTIYRILVTSLSGMGPIKGAIKAAAVIQRWSPTHVLMVGIAGGVDGEIALGDVIVASQVADYTVGKVRESGPREERWMAYPADADLLDAAANFAVGWEDLVVHPRPEASAPNRYLGVVASGGDVVASKKQIDLYLADWPKLIGVEMEGGGVAAGLHDDITRPRFLMIRGVSDLANAESNAEMKKLWRTYSTDQLDVSMISIVCTTRSTKRERHDLVSVTRCAHGSLETAG